MNKLVNNHKYGNLLLIAVCLFLFFLIFVFDGKEKGCFVEKKTEIIKGYSMAPIFNAGEKVEALFGYYDCHDIKRDDFVVIDRLKNELLLKTVVAVPGDAFYLKQEKDRWNIFVNKEILKNSEGEPYSLSDVNSKLLHLYEKDYNGIIPDSAYLILGNLSGGSMDSTQFGLIGKNNIIAKVETW